jgi:hypothetical protein
MNEDMVARSFGREAYYLMIGGLPTSRQAEIVQTAFCTISALCCRYPRPVHFS